MNDVEKFKADAVDRIKVLGAKEELKRIAYDFQHETGRYGYLYNFEWLGLPIIQYPQDMVALQEIIFEVQPDLIIEAGVARGGSLIFNASMLALLDLMEQKQGVSPVKRHVVGIDIDIRAHNRANIERHPLSSYITLLQGSSVDPTTVRQVRNIANHYKRPLVLLDSNHTHEHVLEELRAYADLVCVGSYVVVYDTVVELSPPGYYGDRPWDKGNSPLTAVREFLAESNSFEIDETIPNKLLITVAPDGFLKRVR
jgi:cephalosporin hydroxylase